MCLKVYFFLHVAEIIFPSIKRTGNAALTRELYGKSSSAVLDTVHAMVGQPTMPGGSSSTIHSFVSCRVVPEPG